MRKKIATTVVAASAVLMFGVPSAFTGVSAAASGPKSLTAAVPQAVKDGQAHVTGRVAASTQLRFLVTLKIRSWAKLNSTLAAVSTPGSPRFRHYLTQNQANRLFDPTASQQQRVSRWLRSNGLGVTHTFANHLVVDGKGSVSAIDQAFHVTLKKYVSPGGSPAHFFAPSSAPVIPASLSRIVNTVVGLDNTSRMVSYPLHSSTIRRHGTVNGYFPSDFRAAYNVPKTDLGAGEHIGITLFDDPPSNANLQKWAGKVGLGTSNAPTTANGHLIVHKVAGGVTSGDSGESGIDVENSFGMAPKSFIDYWEFNDNTSTGAISALNQAGLTGPKSSGGNGLPFENEISSSWGQCEDSNDGSQSTDPVFASNSTTGHAYLFSSGDTGSYCPEYASATKDDPYPQYPTSSPYVTSVGGTAFGPGSGTYAPVQLTKYPGEVSWYYDKTGNQQSDQCYSASVSCPEGSSGGYSNRYVRPTVKKYGWNQSAPGLPTTAAGSCPLTSGKHLCRAFPDISGPGDPDYSGAIICYSGGCETDGGTSLASPVWAGMMADINGYLAPKNLELGFPNALFYTIARGSTYHQDFHDIVCPNTATRTKGGCSNGKYSTGAGWDAVTGLGSPNVANLQADLTG